MLHPFLSTPFLIHAGSVYTICILLFFLSYIFSSVAFLWWDKSVCLFVVSISLARARNYMYKWSFLSYLYHALHVEVLQQELVMMIATHSLNFAGVTTEETLLSPENKVTPDCYMVRLVSLQCQCCSWDQKICTTNETKVAAFPIGSIARSCSSDLLMLALRICAIMIHFCGRIWHHALSLSSFYRGNFQNFFR